MTVFDRYLEQAKDFARRLVRTETGTRRWATVTAIDPVRITYDGTTVQGIIPPVVLGTPVTIGDRVRAHTIHDRTYIWKIATPDTGWLPIVASSGYTSTGLVREIDGTLYFKGGINGAIPANAATNIGSIPAALAPASEMRVSGARADGQRVDYIALTQAGNVRVMNATSFNNTVQLAALSGVRRD